MFDRWRLEKRREKAASGLDGGPLKAVLEAPLVPAAQRFDDTEFLCIDFETTGLEPKTDNILSVGSVLIKNGEIAAASAHYDVIAFDGVLDEDTLTIHGLTHDALAKGIALDDAMERLFQKMPGTVLVAHNIPIERTFLDAYCRGKYGVSFEAQWICTLALERSRASSQYKDVSYRLGQSRARYNLPRYTAHHALIDALAGAELLLAQAAHRSHKDCRLKDLL